MGIFEKNPHAFRLIVKIWPYLAIYGGYGHAGYGPDQKNIFLEEAPNTLLATPQKVFQTRLSFLRNSEFWVRWRNYGISLN